MNFAVFAKKLGHESSFMGVFGSDEEAAHVLSAIKKNRTGQQSLSL
ncbi:hypothetical protein [Enterococcus faecium]|nr:hypothetical protein [Enterococcus faecium]